LRMAFQLVFMLFLLLFSQEFFVWLFFLHFFFFLSLPFLSLPPFPLYLLSLLLFSSMFYYFTRIFNLRKLAHTFGILNLSPIIFNLTYDLFINSFSNLKFESF
jgi:hypothetical protein